MIARRSSFALFVSLIVLVGMLGVLGLASAPALAALKTTFLRTVPVAVEETAGFDAAGNIYNPEAEGRVVRKLDSADAPAEFAGSGLALYIVGSELTGTPEGAFGEVVGVAVAANGDIYVADRAKDVVDVFEASGVFLAKWTGSNTPGKSFGRLEGVKVDKANGRVFVVDRGDKVVDVFEGSGAYLFQITGAETPEGLQSGDYSSGFSIVVDDVNGEVLVAPRPDGGNIPAFIYVFDSTGRYLTTWDGGDTPAGTFGTLRLAMAVDQATGEILTTHREERSGIPGARVGDVFDAAGDFLTPEFSVAQSDNRLALNEATGEIYSHEFEAKTSSVYSLVVVPDVLTGAPSSLHSTTAVLSGMVGPAGVKVNGCHFEYGTEAGVYANTVECANTAQIGEGIGLVSVNSLGVSGLQPDTRYHFRLDADNVNGSNESRDGTFFTSTAPLIEGEALSKVGSVDAIVTAGIDAAALPTTYRVEYGLTSAYGSSTKEVELGNSDSVVGVVARLDGLQSDSEYHFRFVATNALGSTLGGDMTFRTSPASGVSTSALPDGRVVELVSPVRSGEDWDVYAPVNCTNFQEVGEFICSPRPVQASSDGGSLAYVGDPVPGGGGSSGNIYGNEFVSSVGTNGWKSIVMSPTASTLASGVYSGFSTDLSVGVLSSSEREPLTADASPHCTSLYSRTVDTGGYRVLFTKTRNPAEESECYEPKFAGSSADGSVLAFEMSVALTAEAPGGKEANLYESSSDGQLRLVNKLPDGTAVGNAKFGSANGVLLSNVVSADGSRLFWTDLNNGNLYVRENGGTSAAKTVLVSEGGEYWTASTDGSRTFFTKGGDLYSFDVDSEQTTDLASGGEVQGVIGASEDGSYVYYVALAAMKGAGGTVLKNSQGREPVPGENNLYVFHAGVTQFVATLNGGDSVDWLVGETWFGGLGVNEASSVYRTAEVSPDGHGVVFMSTERLTGYDNASTPGSKCEGALGGGSGGLPFCEEVFAYNAGTGMLSCASCSPTGAPIAASGGLLSLPTGHVRLPRWINQDGTRVFFDSAEPLVPQVVSGKMQVYEWEQDGTGTCEQSGGCIFLLSSGAGANESLFLDAGASGNDVFFLTRAKLVAQDVSDDGVVYDARVDGVQPISLPACTGTGCQGIPPAPPIFATPSSVTFSGVGNFEPQVAVKPRVKPKTAACGKGFVKKHGKCARQKKAKRSGTRKRGKK